jgi:carbon-monoxide dehydrogenase medium subunit
VKPARFKYHDPQNLDDTLRLVGSLEGAKVLAGGQSLMPMMNFRFVQPDHVIDINGVAELSGIQADTNTIRIGAMTRQRDIEFSADVTRLAPLLQTALGHVGHRQTRNRGTIGGSLGHLDPSAELVNCISVHDGAAIHVRSKHGSRDLPLSEFAVGFMTHSLAEDEIIVGVTLPCWSSAHGYAFVETARRRGDFAIAAVAALIDLDKAGNIARAAISVAGVTPTPMRPAAAERLLIGQKPGSEAYRAAAASLEFIDPLSDAYVTADYRMHLAGVLTRRALEAAALKAQERRTND